MALTASATASTAEFIVDSLQMDPDALVKVKHSVNRANIYLEGAHFRTAPTLMAQSATSPTAGRSA